MNRTRAVVLEPNELSDLQAIFNNAWLQLQTEYAGLGLEPDDTIRERLAEYIYEFGTNEETRPKDITELALQAFRPLPVR